MIPYGKLRASIDNVSRDAAWVNSRALELLTLSEGCSAAVLESLQDELARLASSVEAARQLLPMLVYLAAEDDHEFYVSARENVHELRPAA